jgi:xylan 1,4-beta-xylosidase
MIHMKRFLSPVVVLLAIVLSTTGHLFSQSTRSYSNPILAGFYPDPSICRVDSDFYLVNSTFSYYPGITVFHSRDLTHWNLIGYVLNRPEEFKLDGQGVSRGLFAPAIRYHRGTFYVTCTLVDGGGNFVATAHNPAGPWSSPVWLPRVNGIDPSLFFDDDGKSYITYNSIPPDDKSLYSGHRTIRIFEFDPDSLAVKGEEHILVNGGTDITKEPVWIEGPHILKKDGTYFLLAAEGGTAENHSEVVFKSANVLGPYIPYDKNPVLTQRELDPGRKNPITCTGHADLVQMVDGNWWAVFLGCRPYEDDYFNTGRETFLAPVRWIDKWPVINPDQKEVQFHYPLPMASNHESNVIPQSGNFDWKDDFQKGTLDIHWMFLRTPQEQWYSLDERKGFLAMRLRPETCAGKGNPSFLGHRQQHAIGSASAAIEFSPRLENEKAGLLVFQNEHRYYYLCKSLDNNESVVQLYSSIEGKSVGDSMRLVVSQSIGRENPRESLSLKIEARGNTYAFLYALGNNAWRLLKDAVDAKYLSTKDAGGFVGCMYALYATSLGRPSSTSAYYDWFEYSGNDLVFR